MSDLPAGFVMDEAPPAGFVLDEAPAAAPSTSLWKRATVNAGEAFHGTSTGALVDRVESGQVDQQRADQAYRAIVEARNAKSDVGLRNFQPTPEEMRKHANNPSIFSNPFAGMPAAEMEAEFNKLTGSATAARAEYDKKREANRAEYDSVPSWKDEPSLIGKAIAGATALGGSLVGGLPAAENLIGGAGPKIARAAGESVASHVARNVGTGIVENAVAGSVANPAVQAGQISRGERDAFSPEEFASSVIVGGGIGGGIRLTGMMWNGVRGLLARRAGIHPDAVTPEMVTPEGVKAAVAADPQLAALAEANGITRMDDPRNAILAEKLAAQRAPKVPENVGTLNETATAGGVKPVAGGPEGPVTPRRAWTSEVTEDGTIHPAALTPPRAPDTAPIRVDGEGNAYREAPGIEQAQAKGAILGQADQRALPAPGRAHMTPEELDRLNADRHVDTPEPLYGQEGRAPQTRDDVAAQRQAGGAFTLAERQADRAGPDVRDTQTAGRPLGVDDNQKVMVDPASEHAVRFKGFGDEGKVWVEPYDPRTGKPIDGTEAFQVEPRALKELGYGQNPRMAQDFVARADGPKPPEAPRGARDPVARQPEQTYRAEAPAEPAGRVPETAPQSPAPIVRDAPAAPAASPDPVATMHTEALPEIERAITEHGASESTVAELGQHYQRAEGETPKQAFDRAVDRATDDMVSEPSPVAKPKETARVEDAAAPQNSDPARARDSTGVRGADGPREGAGPDQGGRAAEDGSVASGEHPAEPGTDGRPAAEAPRSDGAPEVALAQHHQKMAQSYNVRAKAYDQRADDLRSQAKRGDPTKPIAQELLRQAEEAKQKATDVRSERDEYLTRVSDANRTLNSNPFADPKLWAWAAKSPGAFSDTWKAGVADLFDSVRQARSQKSDAVKTKAAADVGRGYFRSIDAELNALAKKYKSDTIEGIRSMFFARPDVGRDGAVEQTFSEGLLEHGQGNLNKIADILKPLTSTTGKVLNLSLGRDTSKLLQVVKLVENPRNIRAGTPIHDAAAALRKVLDENHKYLKAAGVDIGKIDGYFPHMLKADEVRRNPDAFVKMAAAEMLKNAATTGVKNLAEANIRAEAWRDHVSLAEVGVKEGNTDFIKIGHMPNADFAKERVLIKKSPEFFQRFYHTDPIDSLTTFFGRTAQRAEWAKRFGDKNEVWMALKEKMIAEGNAAAIPQVVDMIAKSAGVSPMVVSRQTAAFIGGLKTWGGLATMPLAWLSSISETAMPAVRSGRPLNAPADIGRLAVSIAGGLKKEKSLASDLGLIANGYGDSLMSQRHGLDGSGKVRTWIHNAFFKATLLDGLTHNQVAVAVNSAQTFVRRLGLDVADKPNATLSKKLLTELGVSDHAGFSKWVARQSEGRPTVADTRDGSEHAAAYRTAIARFANQTIMRPSASTFTRFSQHPVGGLIMQLQSFNYAFTNNVLARLKNLAVESIRPGSGLNGAERLAAWGPILAMLPLMGIAGAVSEGRDALFRDKNAKPMEDWERGLRVVSRSGMTGTLDPYINLVTSARYRSEASSLAMGPVAGKLLHTGLDSARGLLPGANSGNTNTAERAFAQAFYDLVVAPAAMTATLPLPAIVRTPAIQALKLGEIRGGAVDAVAGPKAPAHSGPPKMPSPPKMPKAPKY